MSLLSNRTENENRVTVVVFWVLMGLNIRIKSALPQEMSVLEVEN